MIRLCAFADEADERLEGQIEALKRNGISLIELRGIDGVNVSKLTLAEAEKYAQRLADAGIAVWSIGSPIGKVDISVDLEGYLSEVRHVCRLARIFDTERIRMFSFYGALGCEDEVIRRLRRMVEVAREEGVRLLHENEKRIFGDTLERVLRLREKVPELGLIYDPANFIEVGESAEETLEALLPQIDYFHIKDAIAESGEIVPAGFGDGRISELILGIGEDGDKVLTVEPHLTEFVGFDQLDSCALKNKFAFANADEAFDAAVTALKTILIGQGYKETEGGFIKR